MESRIQMQRPALERREVSEREDGVGCGSHALHGRMLAKALAALVGCFQLFSFTEGVGVLWRKGWLWGMG